MVSKALPVEADESFASGEPDIAVRRLSDACDRFFRKAFGETPRSHIGEFQILRSSGLRARSGERCEEDQKSNTVEHGRKGTPTGVPTA
jgi:hypothetical protein